MGQPYIDQDSFAWRNDDGTEVTATWIDNTNDDLASPVTDTNYRLRFLLQNTGDKDAADGYLLRYNVDAAGWVTVTTTSSYVRSFASAYDGSGFSDGDPAYQRIGAGTYDVGECDDTGITGSFSTDQNDESEIEFCIQFRSADIGSNTVELQVWDDATVVLDLYTNTPSTTFTEAIDDLVAEQGTLSLTGQVADFQRGLVMAAAQGTLSLTGQDAGLEKQTPAAALTPLLPHIRIQQQGSILSR